MNAERVALQAVLDYAANQDRLVARLSADVEKSRAECRQFRRDLQTIREVSGQEHYRRVAETLRNYDGPHEASPKQEGDR